MHNACTTAAVVRRARFTKRNLGYAVALKPICQTNSNSCSYVKYLHLADPCGNANETCWFVVTYLTAGERPEITALRSAPTQR